MKKKEKKIYLQRKKRYLKKVIGTSERPRLAVFRSHKHIYGQLIDDKNGHTLAFSSTLDAEVKTVNETPSELSFLVGTTLGKKAIAKNISQIVFDRGKRPYHGRIKRLAEGARTTGLIF